MDTKLKKSNSKISNNTGLRIAVFGVFVLSLAASFICTIMMFAAMRAHVESWECLNVLFAERYQLEDKLQWALAYNAALPWLSKIGIAGGLTALLFLWLAITTGGKQADGSRKLYRLDRIWTEVQIAIGIFAFVGFVAFLDELTWHLNRVINMAEPSVSTYKAIVELFSPASTFMAAVVILCAAVIAWIFLSIIRLIKSKNFFKYSLIYKLCAAVINALLDVINGGSLMRKVVAIALIVCLLSATVFLAPVMLIVVIVFAPKWVKKFEDIQKGIDEVKSGNLSYKIQIDPNERDNELKRLAEGINEISEASNMAVQNELKNQRMKTELISNVSHDLKTPLTSMVTYVDLLKKEGLDSPNAPTYLGILEQKTQRLKKLTEDLFEAAKASSGAIPVNMEKVDMLSLVNQTLGEMNDRIEASTLEFIVNAANEKYYVSADGQHLCRVVENLMSNVLKYAQDGSRVYIDLKDGAAEGAPDGMVMLEMKNISKQQLNINPDELMERFKRGDDSRSTEGSGLGLAIAKDLVKLMNGWFEIIIDGDLFKARVLLNKTE